MGFFDDVQAQLNRGVAGASRAGSTMKLKSQINEVLKRRQALAAQLGASLYEATKADPALRMGREELYDGIAACDAERNAYQAEINRLEAEGAAQTAAAQVYECPFCHARVAATSLFCSGCGKSMAEIQASYKAATMIAGTPNIQTSTIPAPFGACPVCGTPIPNEGDAFCMGCGARLDTPAVADETSAVSEIAGDVFVETATSAAASSVPGPNPVPDDVGLEGLEPVADSTLNLDSPQGEGAMASCAQRTDDVPVPAPQVPSAPNLEPDIAPFGICPKCGTPAKSADAAFCMSCGTPLGAATSQSSQVKED